jgi:hypothetical protein
MSIDYLYNELNKVRCFKDANGNSVLLEMKLKGLVKKVSMDFCHKWESDGNKNPRRFVDSKEFVTYIKLYEGFLEFKGVLPDHILGNIQCLAKNMNVAKSKVNSMEFDDCSKEFCEFKKEACIILESLDLN